MGALRIEEGDRCYKIKEERRKTLLNRAKKKT